MTKIIYVIRVITPDDDDDDAEDGSKVQHFSIVEHLEDKLKEKHEASQ